MTNSASEHLAMRNYPCGPWRSTLQWRMIKSFRHRGLEKFFTTGSKAGIQPAHANKLRIQLTALDSATKPGDMKAPGWDLHQLKGNLAEQWSISVNGNWRLIFAFEGTDAVLVDYLDYH